MMLGGYDVCVLGGGVSGVSAVITMKRENPDIRVVIIEKTGDILKKLAASGNGRCNISNTKAKGFTAVSSFMYSMGVYLKSRDDGWVYPYSMRAETVVNALKNELHSFDVDVVLNTEVCGVKNDDDGFSIICTHGKKEESTFTANAVCLALGGKAAPKFGTVGDGFVIAKKIGLKVSPVYPVLTKINLEGIGDDLAGVRHDAEISLFHNDRLIVSETGQIQLTLGWDMAGSAGPEFYYEDFRSGWAEGIALSKEWDIYRQQYCGCLYSEMERYASELRALTGPA